MIFCMSSMNYILSTAAMAGPEPSPNFCFLLEEKIVTCLSVFIATQWSIGQITPTYLVDLTHTGKVIQSKPLIIVIHHLIKCTLGPYFLKLIEK